MKVASWNVNSVRARKDRLLRWLEVHRPDVLCLQEIKVTAEEFPMLEVGGLGYRAALFVAPLPELKKPVLKVPLPELKKPSLYPTSPKFP